MEDWASQDYTRTYADTIYTPETDYDAGVYTLEEAGRDTDPLSGVYRGGRVRVRPAARRPPGAPGHREGFYGNILSDRRNDRAIRAIAWDERPLHYNPSAGPDWAHLVPDPADRPPGGGPAPSLAFPRITPSEALNAPKDFFRGGASGACAQRYEGERALQCAKVVLLIVIIVLLALTLVTAGRLERCLRRHFERATWEAVGALRGGAR